MCPERGLVFTHAAAREGEAKLAPLLPEALRQHRRGKGECSWYGDQPYLQVEGRWGYVDRAIERESDLVGVLLSGTQDQEAAAASFRSARTVTGMVPARVTTAGRGASPGTGKAELGAAVTHRTNQY